LSGVASSDTRPAPSARHSVAIELTAVIVAVTAEEPRVLALEAGAALPSGPFESRHRTLQMGVRSWVEEQTHYPLGYVEQLYTFADRDRQRDGGRAVSISYLGLTRETRAALPEDAGWRSWYRYLPWEDWRAGPPAVLAQAIRPRLRAWARSAGGLARDRRERIAVAFPASERDWNEELVLQRYELLYEAGLVPEAGRNRPVAEPLPGVQMTHDHRRILATAIARLRAKIKYRPVVFELMPASFTLLQLQRAVEARAGRRRHKPNFRRLVEQQGLVEETSGVSMETGGRPAKLMRFRREVLLERRFTGTKLPLYRSG
jgi:hypothetical protein